MSSFKKLNVRDVVWRNMLENGFSDLQFTVAGEKIKPFFEIRVYPGDDYAAQIVVGCVINLNLKMRVTITHTCVGGSGCTDYYHIDGGQYLVGINEDKNIQNTFIKRHEKQVRSAFIKIRDLYPWDFLVKLSSLLEKIPEQKQLIFSPNYNSTEGIEWTTQYDGYHLKEFDTQTIFKFKNAEFLKTQLPEYYTHWCSYLTLLTCRISDKITAFHSKGKKYNDKPFINLFRSFIHEYQYWIVYALYADEEIKSNKNIQAYKLEQRIKRDILWHIKQSHDKYWVKKSTTQSEKLKKIFTRLMKMISD